MTNGLAVVLEMYLTVPGTQQSAYNLIACRAWFGALPDFEIVF